MVDARPDGVVKSEVNNGQLLQSRWTEIMLKISMAAMTDISRDYPEISIKMTSLRRPPTNFLQQPVAPRHAFTAAMDGHRAEWKLSA